MTGHHPLSCSEAACGHFQVARAADDDEGEDEDDIEYCPNCGAGPDEECEPDCDCDECEGIEALTELDAQAIMNGEDRDAAEGARQARIAAGIEHACHGCGCSDSRACPGGCVWATETLCSRCARGMAIAAGAAS